MEKGFSFIELMIVVVIVVIMSTFAMPSYAKYIEKSRGKNAEANLMIIHNMEKRFKLDNDAYYECATVPCNATGKFVCPAIACTIDCANIINAALGLFIRDPYFTYTIDIIEGTSGYKVTATRSGTGPCSGKTMTITDASSVITKGCSTW